MRRVLKPGGRLIFCEHGKAPDESVLKWQKRITPFWKPMAGGCELARPIPDLIREGGFTIEKLETMYLPSTPRPLGFNYWGTAK
jgi:ubiquinone/menaquinone biosynthesis C-methylase UbiE